MHMAEPPIDEKDDDQKNYDRSDTGSKDIPDLLHIDHQAQRRLVRKLDLALLPLFTLVCK